MSPRFIEGSTPVVQRAGLAGTGTELWFLGDLRLLVPAHRCHGLKMEWLMNPTVIADLEVHNDYKWYNSNHGYVCLCR